MQLLQDTTETAVSPAEKLLDALPPVMRFVRHHMRTHRSTGLSVPAFRSLCLLVTVPHANLSAVAEFLGASLPNTSRIVSTLVEKGLVARKESRGDRRQVTLAITAKGRALQQKSRDETIRQLSAVLGSLHPERLAAVATAADALRDLFVPQVARAEE